MHILDSLGAYVLQRTSVIGVEKNWYSACHDMYCTGHGQRVCAAFSTAIWASHIMVALGWVKPIGSPKPLPEPSAVWDSQTVWDSQMPKVLLKMMFRVRDGVTYYVCSCSCHASVFIFDEWFAQRGSAPQLCVAWRPQLLMSLALGP
jgi:hypothetical protein